MTVSIVTDSSCRLPASVRERYRIRQAPLHLLRGDEDLLEDVDVIGPDVYDDPATTTAGSSPDELREQFEAALEDSGSDGVVAILMSRRLSGTWSAARLVADHYPDRVRVVDSRAVGLGLGFAAIAAAQAAQAGADRDGVYEEAIRASSTGHSLITLQTLDNLRSGGRISAATRLFGSALSIKPVLTLVDGMLVVKERQRTFSKALERMLTDAAEEVGDTEVVLGVQHCGVADVADAVAEDMRSRLRAVGSVVVTDLGPVLSRHVGQGAVSVVTCEGIAPIEGIETSRPAGGELSTDSDRSTEAERG